MIRAEGSWFRTLISTGTPADFVKLGYGYDEMSNRVTREDVVAKTHSQHFDELYTYDGLNRLIDMQRGELSGGSIINRNFVQNWQTPSTSNTALDATGNWNSFRQDNNADGSANTVRRTSMTYPNGRTLTYVYNSGPDDNLSRVSHIQDSDVGSTHLAEYTYLGMSDVVKVITRSREQLRMPMDYRPLGRSGIQVSSVALGCWPIAGMTSLDVNEADSLDTLQACFDVGINFFDTAYAYGRDGQSERLIARAIAGRRDQVVIATKVGIAWDASGRQVKEASSATIRRQFETSLRRLHTDHVELLYLHAPDPQRPIEESAATLRQLLDEGKARAIGASNCTVAQLAAFEKVCPLSACQPHYNMLQREIECDVLPWCRQRDIAVVVYWPLLKGLLAGKLPREHVFAPGDGRAKYPMFQGAEWHKNQDLLDRLRSIAHEVGVTLAQLVIAWTIAQPGITSALCGAKRAAQVRENAGGAGWQLSAAHMAQIDAALRERGRPVSQAAV